VNIGEIRKIKQILEMYGARPNADLGQNFLIDSKYLDAAIEAAAPLEGKTVLEIGPGMGVLTRKLSKVADEVIAVEVDGRMISILKTMCLKCTNLTVREMDIRKFDPTDIGDYKIVANLPYYLTTHVIRKFLEEKNKPEQMVVMVQKEVAERICARPNKMNMLGISVQFYGEPTLITVVPREAFYPTPQVNSAIVRINLYGSPLFTDVDPDRFFRLIKAGFGEKRKQLINSLSVLGKDREELVRLLKLSEIDPQRRPETLSLSEWHIFYKNFYSQPRR
jgi:16S rRNA (adenine1518-N6/adenine1519-N6)-dimethyltransferase